MVAFNRVVLSGSLAGGAERWSVGLAYATVSGILPAGAGPLQDWADDIAGDLTALVLGTNLANGISSQGDIDEVRTYHYPSAASPAGSTGAAPVTRVGSTSPMHPLPTAAVISLRTALAGRSYRGRVYWPGLGVTISTAGRWASGFPLGLATDFASLNTRIIAAAPAGSDLYLGVVSRKLDVITPVISASVGDVPDTQRRRRDDLVETYFTVGI